MPRFPRTGIACLMVLALSGCWQESLKRHRPLDMFLAKQLQNRIPWQLRSIECHDATEAGRHCWVVFRTEPKTPAFAVTLQDAPSIEGQVSHDNPLPIKASQFPGEFKLELYEHRPDLLYVKFNSSIEDDNVKPAPAAMELRNIVLKATMQAEIAGGAPLAAAIKAKEDAFNKVRPGTVAKYTPIRQLLSIDVPKAQPREREPEPTKDEAE